MYLDLPLFWGEGEKEREGESPCRAVANGWQGARVRRDVSPLSITLCACGLADAGCRRPQTVYAVHHRQAPARHCEYRLRVFLRHLLRRSARGTGTTVMFAFAPRHVPKPCRTWWTCHLPSCCGARSIHPALVPRA